MPEPRTPADQIVGGVDADADRCAAEHAQFAHLNQQLAAFALKVAALERRVTRLYHLLDLDTTDEAPPTD